MLPAISATEEESMSIMTPSSITSSNSRNLQRKLSSFYFLFFTNFNITIRIKVNFNKLFLLQNF